MSKTNFSGTKCPKCEHTAFEIVCDQPTASAREMYYLRCTSCKTFLFVLPLFDINTQIKNLHDEVIKIKQKFRIL